MDDSCSEDTDTRGNCEAEIKEEEVVAAVKIMKPGKAVGWDTIPNEAIKHAGAPFILLLTLLFT